VSQIALYRSIGARIVTIPIVAFVVGLSIAGAMGFVQLQRWAERETREKAITTLGLLSAVQHSADETGAPHVPRSKANAAHSGAAAVRQVVRRFEAAGHESAFRYRHVAINPIDPRNAANNFESRLISAFAHDARLTQAEDEIQENGRGYHVLATPVTVSQESCLRCHGSPNGTPGGRIEQVGRTAGLGWKRGQVVGIDIIYAPGDASRAQALGIFWSVTRSVGILVLICAALLFLRTHLLIARPVRRMLAASQAFRKGEWADWSDPRFPDELAVLASSFRNTSLALRDKVVHEEKLRAMFQQFIPASVAAKALGKNADELLVGTRHPVTVMIVNIRNFKLLMDHLPPQETVATLNEYFGAINKIIVANKGMVSKYSGDSIMALFGMPLDKENHALCAVRAALSIPAALQDLYVRLDERYGWELGVGIGISTGEPIVGSFGSSEHLEYTVLGDVVAEAHRLEAATKSVPEEDSILISEATYRCVMSDVHVLDLGDKADDTGATHSYVVQGLRSELRSSRAA
jgi:class 3 adenylate cyclase